MYIPLVREQVRVRGRSDTFVVVQVDYSREVAEVECGSTNKTQMRKVPFQELFAVWERTELELADSAAD